MIEVGKKFPSDSELLRIGEQNKWEKMFHGTHVYNKIIDSTGIKRPVDPLVPVPASISEITSDLLFGEFPKFDFGDDTAQGIFEEWFRVNPQITTDLLEAATYASPLGTIFWNIWKYEDVVYYDFLKSNKMIWEEDRFGLTNVKIFEVNEELMEKMGKQNKVIIYHIQEHYFGYDESKRSPYMDDNRVYIFDEYDIKVTTDNMRKVKDIFNLESHAFEEKFLPLIKIDNLRQMGIKIGKSDYQGKEQMFAEVDNRIDQINYVLQEHAEPWIGMPQGVQNPSGVFNRALGKMYEKAPGNADDSVSIANWNAQLESAFKAIETQLFLIFFTSRISAPISGLDKGGNVESGRALKWKSINTMSMINRKRKYWEEAIKKFFWVLVQTDKNWKNVDLDSLTIHWQDGLPMDSKEIAESVTMLVQNGLMSKLRGTEITQELPDDKAQEEQDQINSEKQASATINSSQFRVEV